MALTDGKAVLMDANLQPTLNYKGILCENSRGDWSIKCVDRAHVRKNMELAGQTCTLLGFSGYSSHNVLMVDEIGAPKRKPFERVDVRQFGLRSWDRMIPNRYIFKRSVDNHPVSDASTVLLAALPKHCFGLQIECVPHTIIPIETVVPPEPTEKPQPVTTTVKPIDPTTIPPPIEVTTTPSKLKPPPQPVNPINPTHQKDKPTVIVPFVPENETDIEFITNNFAAPWTASVYIDGDLACIGVLLGQYWVLAERSCVENVK